MLSVFTLTPRQYWNATFKVLAQNGFPISLFCNLKKALFFIILKDMRKKVFDIEIASIFNATLFMRGKNVWYVLDERLTKAKKVMKRKKCVHTKQ